MASLGASTMKTIAFSVFFFVALFSSPYAWEAPPGASGGEPVISAIRVHLFFNKSATWSGDLFEAKPSSLANSMSGPEASNASLVVIEVSGPPGAAYSGTGDPLSKRAVHLVARAAGKSVIDRSQPIPVLSDAGKAYLAFMIYPSGCNSIQLIATLVGAGRTESKEKSLDFACGE
jgi:hypothetical protein